MVLWTFSVLLLLSSISFSFPETSRGINVSEKHLGYFIKSVKQDDHERSRQNSIFKESVKFESGVKDEFSDKTIVIIVKPDGEAVKEGRSKNFSNESLEKESDSPLPLHVANTARKECLDGFQADENGVCQKVLQPKTEKSFKLRRRKRAEQPKLSYADVVKYGRNPPKELLTMKPEILTPRPQAKIPVTTMPTAIPFKSPKEVPTTKHPQVRLPATIIPTPKQFESPKKIPTTQPITKAPATVIKFASATTLPPATVKLPKPGTVTSTSTRVPPVVTKPSRKDFGDINQAFLHGEKSSIVAQSTGGKGKFFQVPIADKKTFDATRLRRWIGMI